MIWPTMVLVIPHEYSSFFLHFLSKCNVLKITTKFCAPFFLFHNNVAHVLVCLYSLLLMLSGDVEINPEYVIQRIFPNLPLENLNSISAHDYSKLFFESIYYTS